MCRFLDRNMVKIGTFPLQSKEQRRSGPRFEFIGFSPVIPCSLRISPTIRVAPKARAIHFLSPDNRDFP